MKIGLVLDESEKYDGYNWHNIYAEEFGKLGDILKKNKTLSFKKISSPDFIKEIKKLVRLNILVYEIK